MNVRGIVVVRRDLGFLNIVFESLIGQKGIVEVCMLFSLITGNDTILETVKFRHLVNCDWPRRPLQLLRLAENVALQNLTTWRNLTVTRIAPNCSDEKEKMFSRILPKLD